ncbi:hypothetical protein EOS93_09815 [Rhizobium sp. RMa-01]|nr:hypothetical protein BBJ66_06105 [Rhizobium sp. RSm-3]RVU11097.1 hypothetical protein EOS93_09815 [Rhizobium sp. RMa-01]
MNLRQFLPSGPIAAPRILLFLFRAKTPMNRRYDEISAGDDDANYRPGLPRALSGREVRVFGAWI